MAAALVTVRLELDNFPVSSASSLDPDVLSASLLEGLAAVLAAPLTPVSLIRLVIMGAEGRPLPLDPIPPAYAYAWAEELGAWLTGWDAAGAEAVDLDGVEPLDVEAVEETP